MIRARVTHGDHTVEAQRETMAATVRAAAHALGLTPGKTRERATPLEVGEACTWPWSHEGRAVDLHVERVDPVRSRSGPNVPEAARSTVQRKVRLPPAVAERFDALARASGGASEYVRHCVERDSV